MPKGFLRSLLVSLFVALAAATAFAERFQVLVLKDGRSMQVRRWVRDGDVVRVTPAEGPIVVVRADLVDFERTRTATEASLRPPTPTPAPTRKKSIVEVAREMQERRRSRAPTPGLPDPRASQATPPPTPVFLGTPVPGPTPELADATPEPGPTRIASVAVTPVPEATPEPAPTVEPAEPAEAASRPPFLLYGGVAAVLAVVLAGVVLALKRKAPAPAPAAARAAEPVPAEEELLVPAFADEVPASDLPTPELIQEESLAAPAEIGGAVAERLALSDGSGKEAARKPSAILEDGVEVQVRIESEVYTCPDLATLKRWVEEGRVIENSEVLAPDGSWLMGGSIPDLEEAFERRRQTLGY